MTQTQTHAELCKEYAAQKLEKAKLLSELNRKEKELKEMEAIKRDFQKYKSLNNN